MQPVDQSPVPEAHIGSWIWQHSSVIPVGGRDGESARNSQAWWPEGHSRRGSLPHLGGRRERLLKDVPWPPHVHGVVHIHTLEMIYKPDVLAHYFNPTTWEAEAGGSLSSRSYWSTEWIPGQLGLHRDSLPQNNSKNRTKQKLLKKRKKRKRKTRKRRNLHRRGCLSHWGLPQLLGLLVKAPCCL